ncbi:hypothetical protein [Puia dinghuensis]|uniref:Uncharacterized protein n=1 Tax=Puia dinghuensis TaxID=1792502 RepID=A0A8J2UCH0_9BACT|nr:hypothetical protein [Puia dinghuensis]GGA97334.1 hypothetical protein GCM10011511_20850 [Puia dinghuensis]
MLSKEEERFIRYWEQNRLRRKKVVRQFLLGIPIGLLFVIPIVINFASGWNKSAGVEANSQDFDPRVLFIALLLIVGFTSIFYQRHKWDQYEQRYRELLARQARDEHAAQATHATKATADPATDPSSTPASDQQGGE